MNKRTSLSEQNPDGKDTNQNNFQKPMTVRELTTQLDTYRNEIWEAAESLCESIYYDENKPNVFSQQLERFWNTILQLQEYIKSIESRHPSAHFLRNQENILDIFLQSSLAELPFFKSIRERFEKTVRIIDLLDKAETLMKDSIGEVRRTTNPIRKALHNKQMAIWEGFENDIEYQKACREYESICQMKQECEDIYSGYTGNLVLIYTKYKAHFGRSSQEDYRKTYAELISDLKKKERQYRERINDMTEKKRVLAMNTTYEIHPYKKILDSLPDMLEESPTA